MTQLSASAIILAGGQGSRLFPLTQHRCKPAVMFGGRFRLIDVAVSNSLNSSITEIFVISQFLAPTINGYVKKAYTDIKRQNHKIHILSPQQDQGESSLYLGTADAIRKNIDILQNSTNEYFVILSGDQLYTMDIGDALNFAKKTDADLVIATLLVDQEDAERMGVMKISKTHEIVDFFEKPQSPEILGKFHLEESFSKEKPYLGSMGIYIFKRETLLHLLQEDPREDFGKHLIPTQMQKGKTYAYIFNGYWEDIGTISSFYEANLKLLKKDTPFDLYNERYPIYGEKLHLPPAKIINTKVLDSTICDGSVVESSEIKDSLIGIRSHIKSGTKIVSSIIMGNQQYSSDDQKTSPYSIGSNCHIEKAIIDEHCVIGNNVKLVNEKNIKHLDAKEYFIRDGIIIVAAGTYLPDGFCI
ncbi:MAG: glucose-1-phosphate adenylyltransferase [Chlamydiae bacterium]|nr:glucose-1-phosphate adenylyltransferase [Chlamydiota bacterium]